MAGFFLSIHLKHRLFRLRFCLSNGRSSRIDTREQTYSAGAKIARDNSGGGRDFGHFLYAYASAFIFSFSYFFFSHSAVWLRGEGCSALERVEPVFLGGVFLLLRLIARRECVPRRAGKTGENSAQLLYDSIYRVFRI